MQEAQKLIFCVSISAILTAVIIIPIILYYRPECTTSKLMSIPIPSTVVSHTTPSIINDKICTPSMTTPLDNSSTNDPSHITKTTVYYGTSNSVHLSAVVTKQISEFKSDDYLLLCIFDPDAKTVDVAISYRNFIFSSTDGVFKDVSNSSVTIKHTDRSLIFADSIVLPVQEDHRLFYIPAKKFVEEWKIGQ